MTKNRFESVSKTDKAGTLSFINSLSLLKVITKVGISIDMMMEANGEYDSDTAEYDVFDDYSRDNYRENIGFE